MPSLQPLLCGLLAVVASVEEPDPVAAGSASALLLVDPEVVSCRFAAGIDDLGTLLVSLDPPDALLAALVPVRSNRLGVHDLVIPAGSDPRDVVERLEGTGLVEFAETNSIGRWSDAPNDPLFPSQWALAQTNAASAWPIEAGDPSVIVAVLDSGTDVFHPDLAPNVFTAPGEIPGNGLDDDANGFVDDVSGWDFFENDADVVSASFHGTFVAGLLAARTDDGFGMAGLAGGQGALPGVALLPIGVGVALPVGSVIDDAIVYATDRGARVITLSLTVGESQAIDLALEDARARGVFVDCAAGNGGGPVGYPARHPSVVAVGGTTPSDAWWSGANKGPEIFLAAPAQDVLSTTLGNGWATSSGTSFSAPLVAATAALVFALQPGFTAEDVREVLRRSARDIDVPGFDHRTGWGVVDAAGALVEAAAGDCNADGRWDAAQIDEGELADGDGDGIPDPCEALLLDATSLSLSAGGTRTFELDGGPGQAGWFYVLLGSATGTEPAFPLGAGLALPLVIDAYTLLILEQPFSPNFGAFVGFLDASGRSTATLAVPPNSEPDFAGTILHHAFVSAPTPGAAVATSAPRALVLID